MADFTPRLEVLTETFAQLLDELVPGWHSNPGMLETPQRMAKAMMHKTRGYATDIAPLLKTFPAPEGSSEMVIVRDIPFHSMCEHHGEPFFGTAAVGYIPYDRVLGLSKLTRIVDVYARRFQMQERLTNQIADALHIAPELVPVGVGVIVKARHFCMECRGVAKQGQTTVTSALRGAMAGATARAEFLSLAN